VVARFTADPTRLFPTSADHRGIQDHPRRLFAMANVARVTEISSRSDQSFEDAMRVGLERANRTLRGVRSAWVKEQRVELEDGRIVAYQVNLLVTFVLED
jgi:flavin-binding protein dodecin